MEHDEGRTFLVIFNSLAQFGYSVYYKVMAANEYGNLPQIRKCIYIGAGRDDIAHRLYQHPEPTELTLHSADIIHRSERQNDVYYYNDTKMFDYLADKMRDRNAIYRITDTEVRWTKNQICPTLKANMGTFPDRVPIIRDDFGIRKLTPMECLAFQGYPKDYSFKGVSLESAYKQCGNTVCVPVIKKIAEKIKEVMLNG